jgi:hypothetical protein
MNDARTIRVVAALALVLGAALFAFGVARERSGGETQEVPVATSPHEEGADDVEGGMGDEHATEPAEPAGHVEPDAVLFGVDLESTPFVVAAVVVSVVVAAALVWMPSVAVVILVVAFAFVFAVADVREVLKQVDENTGGIAAIAGLVCAIHVGAAILAVAAWRILRDSAGSTFAA